MTENQEVGKHQGMTIRSLREEAGLTKQDVIDARAYLHEIVYRLEEDGYDIRSISAEKAYEASGIYIRHRSYVLI